MFSEVASRYDGPTIEKSILEFWRRENVFATVLAQSRGKPQFVFYEGPPTANGRPGIHHVLARTFKDLFPRYKTMRGYYCERKAGWDTHGLPVEHEIEKVLGIYDKRRIEKEVGIAQFNSLCRESVMRYVADWEVMRERMGFWVDLQHAYFTLHNDYIESVWYLLKQLWDRGLIYQGYKVVPYDPRIGATLSSHEVALGYRDVEDPSIFVRFRSLDERDTYFLVWTTTPWTLPANLLLAVHPDVDYVWVRLAGETLVLAWDLLAVLGDAVYTIARSALGKELDGARYERLFDFLPATSDICRVRMAAFVTTGDGTGIVHIAPAYGEDDLMLGQQYHLPVLHAVGEDGSFVPEVLPVAGMFFKDADPMITEILRERGLIYRAERKLHSYPFGWRTGDPLIYYAKNAWYIRTTSFRDRMVAFNKSIDWVPANIRDGRFGNWLENNVDWALSRERFWGTPLPLWTDGWIISVLEETIVTATEALDHYDTLRAGRAIENFVDLLSNWYVRGNRRRFWKAESGVDKQSAYATLYECLETVNRMIAPFMPFLSEAVYQNLVRRVNAEAPSSVHMATWPAPQEQRLDRALLADMKVVQQVITLGRAARNESSLKVRQPLSRLLVRLPDEFASGAVARHSDQIRDELNIKVIEVIPRDAALVTYRIKPNLPVVGKRYGRLIPAIRAALARSDGSVIAKLAARGELVKIEVDGQTIELWPDALLIETTAAEGFACAEDAGYLVGLDTKLTEELVREGLTREIIRTVQDARKQARLDVSDRIVLNIDGNEFVVAAISAHREYIVSEALVNGWQELSSPPAFSIEHSLGAARWQIRLARDGLNDE